MSQISDSDFHGGDVFYQHCGNEISSCTAYCGEYGPSNGICLPISVLAWPRIKSRRSRPATVGSLTLCTFTIQYRMHI